MSAAAVLASYVKMSTLVDGTMRVVLDIEPTAAPEAFAMLGAPGSPIALARITDAAAVAQDRRAQGAAEKKSLSLASKVALTCGEASFQSYLYKRFGLARQIATEMEADNQPVSSEIVAAEVVRRVIGVRSRSEIREGELAGRKWHDLQAQYQHWQRTGEAA